MPTFNKDTLDPSKPTTGEALTADVRANESATQAAINGAWDDVSGLETGKEDAGTAAAEVAAHDGNAAAHPGTFDAAGTAAAEVAAHDASGAAHGGVETSFAAHQGAGGIAQHPVATVGSEGFAPQLSGVSTQYLDGSGAFSTPAGGGGSVNNPPSVKGDLWTFHTGDTQRIGVGADGQVLVSNNGVTPGIEWVDLPAGSGDVVAVGGDTTQHAIQIGSSVAKGIQSLGSVGVAGTPLLSNGPGNDPAFEFLGTIGIADGAVNNAKLADMPAETIKLRGVGGGSPTDQRISLLTEDAVPGAGHWLIAETPAGLLRKVDVDNLPGGGTARTAGPGLTDGAGTDLEVAAGTGITTNQSGEIGATAVDTGVVPLLAGGNAFSGPQIFNGAATHWGFTTFKYYCTYEAGAEQEAETSDLGTAPVTLTADPRGRNAFTFTNTAAVTISHLDFPGSVIAHFASTIGAISADAGVTFIGTDPGNGETDRVCTIWTPTALLTYVIWA